jgi:hypothetical protein
MVQRLNSDCGERFGGAFLLADASVTIRSKRRQVCEYCYDFAAADAVQLRRQRLQLRANYAFLNAAPRRHLGWAGALSQTDR